MKKIFVKHHLGLGDSIAHNGMIRKIFEDNEPCEIYCSAKPNFHHNISFMYRDNPNIKVLKMDDNETNRHLENFKYDQVISSHFDSGSDFSYEKFGDDAFYLKSRATPMHGLGLLLEKELINQLKQRDQEFPVKQ